MISNFVNWLLEEASNMVMILVKSTILKMPDKKVLKMTKITIAVHDKKHYLAAYLFMIYFLGH